jgi:phospholipase/lecithinase/hemolysin
VPQQVELYLIEHGGKADPNALYVIEGGGNDILGASGILADSLASKIARGIAESELLLRRAGARNFLIPDLLDVGQLPAAQANASFATAASAATNKDLDLLLGTEALLERVQIRRLDVFSLFHDVRADSSHFGFVNITDPCLNIPFLCADPDHALFWDEEHPTEFGHAFFAVTVEASLAH